MVQRNAKENWKSGIQSGREKGREEKNPPEVPSKLRILSDRNRRVNERRAGEGGENNLITMTSI